MEFTLGTIFILKVLIVDANEDERVIKRGKRDSKSSCCINET